jgi:hypothetical protein
MARWGLIAAALVTSLVSIPALAQAPAPPARVGLPVDANGNPTIDPTKNVLDLVQAAIKRQDDLRDASMQLTRTQIEAAEKIDALRAENVKDVANALARKLADEATLRAYYAERLDAAEAKRIDAIRAVDVAAVAVASQRAADQATVLATQVQQSAEALRTLVATTAATVATSQQQLATSLSARLTTLEQAGYQQAGQQKVSDPALAALIAKVDALVVANSDRSGVGTGRSDVTGWFAAIFMGLMSLGMLLVLVFKPQKTSRT